MTDKNVCSVLELATYRERRIKEGSWPPSDEDQKKYWEGRMKDLESRRPPLPKKTTAPKQPEQKTPPKDPNIC